VKKIYFSCLIFLLAESFFVAPVLPAEVPQSDLWKNKVLYAGGSGGLGPVFGPDGTVLGGNISPLKLDWQITPFFALGSGLNFYFAPQTKYVAEKQTDPGSGIMETYAGMECHIIFPLQLKLTFRPNIFSFEFGGGLYVAPVVMNTMVERTNDNGYTVLEAYGKRLFSAGANNPFGFIVTGSAGVKVWQGILYLDLSYLRDFSEITVKFKDVNIGRHLWNMLAINIGYKYGFINSR